MRTEQAALSGDRGAKTVLGTDASDDIALSEAAGLAFCRGLFASLVVGFFAHFGAQERVITSTNRNFESRQGPATRSHLASPETVAASAVAGRITDPASLGPR